MENIITCILNTAISMVLVVLALLSSHFQKTIMSLHVIFYLLNMVWFTRFILWLESDAYTTSTIILFMVLELNVMQAFTFKLMVPLYVVATAVQFSRDAYYSNSVMVLAMVTAATLVYSFWEREYFLREIWIAEKRRVPAIINAHKNANHDIRNVLQEILAVVEMGRMGSNSSSHKSQDENTLSKLELLEEGKKGDNEDEEYNEADLLSEEYTDETILRVRRAVSRMTDRLDTSLRDGQKVIADELSRLVSCNLYVFMCI